MIHKKENTEVRLKNSALEVFAKYGYHGANMADVAKHADANKAAIYYYFDSKKNLYYLTLQNSFRKLVSNFVQKFLTVSDIIRIEEIHIFLDQFFMNNPNILRLFIHEILNDGDDLKRVIEDEGFVTESLKQKLNMIISKIDIEKNLSTKAILKIIFMSTSRVFNQKFLRSHLPGRSFLRGQVRHP